MGALIARNPAGALLVQWLEAYRFFWDEWVSHEYCNLTEEDKKFLASTIKLYNLWSLAVVEEINSERNAVANLIKKLSMGYPVFKEVVVVAFLSQLCIQCRLVNLNGHGKVYLPAIVLEIVDSAGTGSEDRYISSSDKIQHLLKNNLLSTGPNYVRIEAFMKGALTSQI